MARKQQLVECSDDWLRSVAAIMGSASAADRAIAGRNRRIENGEDAVVYWNSERGSLLVGPRVYGLSP